MKHRSLVLIPFLVLPASAMTLSACEAAEDCPYGETLVRDAYTHEWSCVPNRYQTGTPPSSGTSSSSGSSGSKPPSAAPAPTDSAAPAVASSPAPSAPPPGSPPPGSAAACGGTTAQSDSIRVVEKSDPAPALSSAAPNVADGVYQLVQASFYRTDQSTTPVRSLQASLTVQGAALAFGMKDTTTAGQPTESLTFLLGSDNVTKTCESTKGAVSSWFFPVSVGSTESAQLAYDGNTRILRLLAKRTDGTAELVFAK